jgi:predicted RNase H-like HicB family nuclease
MREAIALHIESLRDHGEVVPEPHASARYIAV